MMQEQALWDATGRDADYGAELYALADRRGKRMRLAATAEEAATRAAAEHAQNGARSMWAYQIGAKWRDETRARGALARAREFSMLDAYSFCSTLAEAREIHEACLQSWQSEISELGLHARAQSADCGEVGGLESVEIEIESKELGDAEGKLELAHLFLLGTRYSEAFGLRAKDGAFMQTGCQGVGMSRLLMALLETRRTATGFYGDEAACSHLFWICGLEAATRGEVASACEALSKAADFDGILDLREIGAGEKLRDAESSMCAYRIVASKRSLAAGGVEVQAMDGGTKTLMGLDQAIAFIRERRIAVQLGESSRALA
jgi:prolyl-tRNA synthetase